MSEETKEEIQEAIETEQSNAEEVSSENTEQHEEVVLSEDDIEKMRNEELQFTQTLNNLLSQIKNKVHVDLILGEIFTLLHRNNLCETAEDAGVYAYKLSSKSRVEGLSGTLGEDDSIRYVINPLDNSIIIMYPDNTIMYHNIQHDSIVNGNGSLLSEDDKEKVKPYLAAFDETIIHIVNKLILIDSSEVVLNISQPELSETDGEDGTAEVATEESLEEGDEETRV